MGLLLRGLSFISGVKDAVEVVDWLKNLSGFGKTVAATAAATTLGLGGYGTYQLVNKTSLPLPVMAQIPHQPVSGVSPDVIAVSGDDGQVYAQSFLLKNRNVLRRIDQLCSSGLEHNMARCGEVQKANDYIALVQAADAAQARFVGMIGKYK